MRPGTAGRHTIALCLLSALIENPRRTPSRVDDRLDHRRSSSFPRMWTCKNAQSPSPVGAFSFGVGADTLFLLLAGSVFFLLIFMFSDLDTRAGSLVAPRPSPTVVVLL